MTIVEGKSFDKFYEVRADQNGHYRFSRVVPGTYLLTNRLAGPLIWRLKVVVEAGKESVLDLSQQNNLTVRDDFPRG